MTSYINSSTNWVIFDMDNPPMILNPIADVTGNENDFGTWIILDENTPSNPTANDVFIDIDGDEINLSVFNNTNPNLVTAQIVYIVTDLFELGVLVAGWMDTILELNYQPNQFGTAEITIQAEANGKTVEDTFTVNILQDTNGDTIIGIQGDDNLSGTEFDDIIQGLGGKDTLKGNGGDDSIQGGEGNDQLFGNAGSDLLEGDGGNDVYLIDANDTVIDSSGTNDSVYSNSFSPDLSDYSGIENIVLLGNNDLNATGDDHSNKLTGNGGDNILSGNGDKDQIRGKNGNDTIIGGDGNDVLAGGTGTDFFQFNDPSEGTDRITDFTPVDDTILVNGANFGLPVGQILPEQFTLGTSATTSEHRFIYFASQGILAFDADGVGGNSSTRLAKLSNTPADFSHNDIVVI